MPATPTTPTPTAPKIDFEANRKNAITKAQARTFEDDGKVAIKALRDSLGRYEAAKAANSTTNQLEIERKQNLFLKRWALLLAVGGLRFKDDNGDWVDAAKLNMPVAQIMGCGARVSIVGVEDDRVLNWLLSDESDFTKKGLEEWKRQNYKDNPNISKNDKNSHQLAHRRGFATHGFDRKGKEESSLIKAARKGHLGVDLAIGAYDSKDIHGRLITRDGLSGHAYIHRESRENPPSHNLLLGMEGCTSPKFPKLKEEGQFEAHVPLGRNKLIGAFGTMSLTQQLPTQNFPVQIPTEKEGKYDFFKIDFFSEEAKERLETVLKLNPNDFSDDIAECFPVSIRKKTKVDEKLLASYRGNLSKTTLSPKEFGALNQYCVKSRTSENIDFLMEYEKYERMRLANPNPGALSQEFNKIYTKFIKDTEFVFGFDVPATQVNINSKQRGALDKIYKNLTDTQMTPSDFVTKDIFGEAATEVRELLLRDAYPRFIRDNPNSKPPEKGSPLKNMVVYYHNDKKVLANFNPTGTKTPNTVYHLNTESEFSDLKNLVNQSKVVNTVLPDALYYKDESVAKKLAKKELAENLLAVRNGKFYKIVGNKDGTQIKAVPVDRNVRKKNLFNSAFKRINDKKYQDFNALRGAGYVVYNKGATANPDEVLAHLNGKNGKHIIAVKTQAVKKGEFDKLEEIVKSDLKDKASQENPLPTGFYVEIPKSTDKASTEEFSKIAAELAGFLGTKFDRTKREIPGFLVTDKNGQSFKITRSKKGGFKVTPVEKDVSGQSRLNSSAKKVGNKKTYKSLAELEKEFTIYKLSTDPVASNILKRLASQSLEAEGTDLEQFKKDHSSALAPRDDWQTVTVDLTQLQKTVQDNPTDDNKYYDAAFLMTNILMPKFKAFKDALDKGADIKGFDKDLFEILENWAHRFSQKNDQYKIRYKYQEMQKIRNDSSKTSADRVAAENEFIKHCSKLKGWEHNQVEVLVAVALKNLRENKPNSEIKKALEEAYRQYDEANKKQVVADIARFKNPVFIVDKSMIPLKPLENKHKEKEEIAENFFKKISGDGGLTGEQKEFIEQMWAQGKLTGSIFVSIKKAVDSDMVDNGSNTSDEMPSHCFIKQETVQQPQIDKNGNMVIDSATKRPAMKRVTKTYVVSSCKILGINKDDPDNPHIRGMQITIVDITNLEGKHFIAGCASGEVPVRVVIEAPRENMERFRINPNDRNSAAVKDKIFTKGMADEDKKLFDGAKKDMKMVELIKYAENPREYQSLYSKKAAAPSSHPSPSSVKSFQQEMESFQQKAESNQEPNPTSPFKGMGIKIVKCSEGLKITEVFSDKPIVQDSSGNQIKLRAGQIITHIKVSRNGTEAFYPIDQLTLNEVIDSLRNSDDAQFKIGGKEYQKFNSVVLCPNPDKTTASSKEYVDLAELMKTDLPSAEAAIKTMDNYKAPATQTSAQAVYSR